MSNRVFLDADSSILEKKLKILSDPEDEFENFLQQSTLPCKIVKPKPGFCIKSRELGTENKLFVNVCQTDALPIPKDISETELSRILQDDDPSQFRIPMSIGDVRTETDKKGEIAKAVDVAVNPAFYNKCENSVIFKDFLAAVAFEGVKNKHNIVTSDDRIILKNRKAFGTLQVHRIQQREIDEKIGTNKEESVLQSFSENKSKNDQKIPKIETLSSVDFVSSVLGPKTPQYRFYKNTKQSQVVIGEIKLPDIAKVDELTLDIGEDRILLESKTRNYLLDLFIPCCINQEMIDSEFNTDSKILTITMPLKEATNVSDD